MSRRSILSTSEGTHAEAFATRDWMLLFTAAGIWGASFLFIDIGLDSYAPAVIAPARILFGFLALLCVRSARQPVDRADLPRLAVLGFFWMAFPLSMFPIAQQWIDSSVSGMLNAAMPLSTALLASILLRRLPGPWQAVGLVVGMVGVLLIGWPSLTGSSSTTLGVVLVLLATASYAVAANLVVPLSQRYESPQLLLRVQGFGFLMAAPFGLIGLRTSDPELGPTLALIALGALGTGLAFVAAASLIGRVGATRGSFTTYLVPIVAIVLGATFRDEIIEPITLVGTALVLAGAYAASRQERPAERVGVTSDPSR